MTLSWQPGFFQGVPLQSGPRMGCSSLTVAHSESESELRIMLKCHSAHHNVTMASTIAELPRILAHTFSPPPRAGSQKARTH